MIILNIKKCNNEQRNIDMQVVVPCKRRIKEPIGRLINLCLSQKQFFIVWARLPNRVHQVPEKVVCTYICACALQAGGGGRFDSSCFHKLGSMNVIERQGRKVNSQTNWLTITSPVMASLDCSWMTGFTVFPQKNKQ